MCWGFILFGGASSVGDSLNVIMQRGHTIATIFINVDLGRGLEVMVPF